MNYAFVLIKNFQI